MPSHFYLPVSGKVCNFASSNSIKEVDNKKIESNGRTLVTEDSSEEMFPVVDEEGNIIDAMTRGEAHCGTKRLHPVVHLHVYNSQGALYLQQRADWKEVQPGRWDTAMGGHVDLGESVSEALAREAYEEIGLRQGAYEPRLLKKYVYESKIERELVYIYTTVYDGVLSPSVTETKGGRFWTAEELQTNMGHEVFTPMFEQEYPMLQSAN